MHYDDLELLEKNILILCVYKESILGTAQSGYFVSSIHKCKYVPICILNQILNKPNKFFKKSLKNYKQERYYKLKIKIIDKFYKTEILSIEDVTDSDNKYDQLH